MSLTSHFERLKAPFVLEAYTLDNSRGFPLTSIKAQYVVERLNDVFGIGRWKMTGEYQEKNNGVIYFGKLQVFPEGQPEIEIENVGFSQIKKGQVGDAYKSAKTDCLSKCSSWIGIGNDVYQGKVDEEALYKMKKDEMARKAKVQQLYEADKAAKEKEEDAKREAARVIFRDMVSRLTNKFENKELMAEIGKETGLKTVNGINYKSTKELNQMIRIVNEKYSNYDKMSEKSDNYVGF